MTHDHLQGVGYMVGGFFCIALMDVAAKWLMTDGMTAVQLLALRGWLSLPLIWMFERLQGLATLRTRRVKAQLLRAIAGGVLTPWLFFSGIAVLPLAEATALIFTSVFIMVLFGAVWLREPVGRNKLLAAVIGFSGVLLITRPGAAVFRIEALLPLAAAVTYAASNVMGRWLSQTESTASLIFYMNLAMAIAMSAALPWFWQPFGQIEALAVAAVTVLGLLGHWGIVKAFSKAPIALIAPFEYSALLWAVLFGFWVFDELPDRLGLVGIAVIFSGGVYLVLTARKRPTGDRM